MKTTILLLVLAVLVFVAYKYNEAQKREERERLERAVSDCWKNVAPNSESGAKLCIHLAEQLAEKK